MKRLILTVLAVVCTASALVAKPIAPKTAALVAKHFWTLNGLGEWTGVSDLTLEAGVGEMYLFALDEGGFVVVAADDCALPILGYSPDAVMSLPLPDNMRSWFEGYAHEIALMRQHGVEGSPVVAGQWTALIAGERPKSLLSTPVQPLIATTWSQGTYYNNLCPVDQSTQQHTTTGCVATATAQVMKYWNHPLHGHGTNSYTHPRYGLLSADFGNATYDWTSMPSMLSASSTQQQVDAVATLMYHVGISIVTNYNLSSGGGSSADIVARNGINYPCVENALRQYFDYSPELHGVRLSGYGDENWRDMLRAELDSARPVIYTGYDYSSGHCFVCDGYDSQDRFHFNWGWGGMSDGYFAIGSLNPGVGGIGTNATSSFNIDNLAVVGIRPAVRTNPTTATVTVTCNDPSHATVSGAGTYNNFSDLVTLSVATADGYRFEKWSDGDRNLPRQFWANGDVALSAEVVPVVGDTIAYCSNSFIANSTNRYYGMKLEAANLPASGSIRSVMLFNVYEGDYTVRMYAGDNYSPGVVAYEETFHLDGSNRWETLRLAQPYAIDHTRPLWIIAYCRDNSYPAPLTTYCGNQHGGWTSVNGVVWTQMFDMTFMMKAVMSQPSDVTIVAAVDDTAHGTVQGGGRYALGEMCTLTALASGDYVFDHWSDGNTDNPRSFVANASGTFTAIFSGCAVGSLPLTQDFAEGLDCWTTHSNNPENESELDVVHESSWWGSSDYFRFSSRLSATDYTQYLISPRLTVPNAIDMTLSYRSMYSTPETFEIVYSTTNGAPSSFVHTLRQQTSTLSTWDTLQVHIPSEALYVAIKYTTQHGYSLYVDDIQLIGLPLPSHEIVAAAELEGTGTVMGGGIYEEGTAIVLEAVAAPCFEFVHWQDGNTQNPRPVVVASDALFTATFTPVVHYGQEVVVACDSVEWHGTWYAQGGSLWNAYETTTASGCDSLVTLLLTIHNSVAVDTTIECMGECVIDGVTYTESTTLVSELTTLDGCDSIVTIRLVVTSSPEGIEAHDSSVKVWSSGLNVFLSGLDRQLVTVVDELGRVVVSERASAQSWSGKVPHRGVYVVKVGTKVTKVVCLE